VLVGPSKHPVLEAHCHPPIGQKVGTLALVAKGTAMLTVVPVPTVKDLASLTSLLARTDGARDMDQQALRVAARHLALAVVLKVRGENSTSDSCSWEHRISCSCCREH